MTFVGPPAFVDPAPFRARVVTPVEWDDDAGLIVLESDDGALANYTVWRTLLAARSQALNPFAPFAVFRANFAINTADIGGGNRMSVAQLQEMAAIGHGISSHGRHHRTLGSEELTSGASAGATVLAVTNPGRLATGSEPYTYTLTDGVNSETVAIASRDAQTTTPGSVTLAAPLAHAYDAGATLTMDAESAQSLLQGCVDDLAEWGIATESHAYAWNKFTTATRAVVASIFVSARAADGLNLPSDKPDIYNVRLKDVGVAAHSQGAIEGFLDAVQAEGGVLILMGHAETDAGTLANLHYVLDQAVARGMRLATRAEAAERILSW